MTRLHISNFACAGKKRLTLAIHILSTPIKSWKPAKPTNTAAAARNAAWRRTRQKFLAPILDYNNFIDFNSIDLLWALGKPGVIKVANGTSMSADMQPASIPTRIDSLSSAELSGSNYWGNTISQTVDCCRTNSCLRLKQQWLVTPRAQELPKAAAMHESNLEISVWSWNCHLNQLHAKLEVSSGEGCNKESRISKKSIPRYSEKLRSWFWSWCVGKIWKTPSREDPISGGQTLEKALPVRRTERMKPLQRALWSLKQSPNHSAPRQATKQDWNCDQQDSTSISTIASTVTGFLKSLSTVSSTNPDYGQSWILTHLYLQNFIFFQPVREP